MARRHVLEPPLWPERDGRPRVLVEARDPALRHAVESALGEDYTVVDCEGPHDGNACPAVEGRRCVTAAHADVVICDFLPGDDHSRALPQAVARELREGASVIVQVARPAAEAHADAVAGLRVLHHPVRREDLRGAVAAAVEELAATPVPVVHGPRLGWTPPRLG